MLHNFKNRNPIRSCLLVVALCVLTVSLTFSSAGKAEEIGYAYCEVSLNIRQSPDVNSAILGQYPSGSTIVFLEEVGDWLRVDEGYVSKEYTKVSIPLNAVGVFVTTTTLYTKPDFTSPVAGVAEKGQEDYFLKKENGCVQLSSGAWAPESMVNFGVRIEERLETMYSESDMRSSNMANLTIRYMGTLKKRTRGDGVTNRKSLYFEGDIPIYDIIEEEAYFPSGREIYKIPLEDFYELKNVGDDYSILAAYRTTFYSSSKERKHNIELVSSLLDGTVIAPGQTFSYNHTTGPRTEANGYLMAPVIANGAYELDYGGGVCQVSSTIYAAIRERYSIEVTMRKPHGLEVTYLPVGMDATVSYGSKDLKFKNRYPFPIVLHVQADGGVCLVTVTPQ